VIREARPTSETNPWTTEEENQAQWDRTRVAFDVLKQKMEEAKPDVILCFGDDQIEQFNFSNFPGFAIFVGEDYEGYKTFARQGFVPGQRKGFTEKTDDTWVKVPAHAAFAKEVAVNLVRREFDLSFMTEEANKEHGIGHAFLRPMSNIVPDFDIPTIPFYINCFYGPQPTANRVYQLGKAIREIIENSPQDLRVAVFGSGGLWHTPGNPESYLNEEFDQASLDAVKSGDAKAFADHFDRYVETPIDEYKNDTWVDGGTGMYNGIGSGTGETRNWIAAAAVADGTPGTVIDYVPLYSSPCGVGFAYWEFPE
jgi:aromatic ring-opening dioxygenase catalytic subunit (LigB family)